MTTIYVSALQGYDWDENALRRFRRPFKILAVGGAALIFTAVCLLFYADPNDPFASRPLTLLEWRIVGLLLTGGGLLLAIPIRKRLGRPSSQGQAWMVCEKFWNADAECGAKEIVYVDPVNKRLFTLVVVEMAYFAAIIRFACRF